MDLRNYATMANLEILAGRPTLQQAFNNLSDAEVRHLVNASGQALASFAMDVAGGGGVRIGSKPRIRVRAVPSGGAASEPRMPIPRGYTRNADGTLSHL